MKLGTRPLAGAAAAVLSLGLVAVAGPVTAASEDRSVEVLLDRETINARLAPDGSPDEVSLYSHLTVRGQGAHTFFDPAATEGLRSLSGLDTSPSAGDGGARWEVDLDGTRDLRSVADHDGDLPARVEVDLVLDGEAVTPDELVGRDGWLEVTYRLHNVSHREVVLRYPDAEGEPVTERAQVPLPLVGTVETTLPEERFDELDVGKAIVAGDGRGGTQMQWSVALFEPLGAEVVELSFGAQVRDAQLPPARISLVPAGSHQSPLDTGMASYEEIVGSLGEVEAGADELTAGARELADGAGELLAGLSQLADGAGELGDGLVEARDGSGELSQGLGDARQGGGQLQDGARQLDDGAGEAAAGSREVLDGIGQVEDGLAQLAAPDGVPAAIDGVDALLAGVRELRAGLGDAGDDDTLRWGAAQLLDGADQLRDGVAQAADVLDILLGGGTLPTGDEYPGLPFIADGAEELGDGLCEAADGIGGILMPQLREACDGARQLEEGIRGTEQIVDGVSDGAGQLADGVEELREGIVAIRDGLDEVAEGIDRDAPDDPGLLAGLDELREGLRAAEDGIGQLVDGAGELRDGQGQLVSGLGELRDGTGELRTGADELGDGLGQLDDGGRELASGLVEAEDGARQVGDGAGEARDGGQQLADGAQQLREEGTEVLRSEVGDGRAEQSRTLAFFRAVDERGQTDGMPYGAPAGAEGQAAYVFDLAGTEVDQGLGLLPVLALALLAIAGVVVSGWALRRRAAA
ncbi:hypothetical protein FTX61_14780 [Nitriliruptoraceae bacterium ZYF776]|nr:hypothetical protein [Profundirhabdus halotolerans]